MNLLGISGSLRKGSFNSALLRTASGLMPAGAKLEIASIAGIPLYDGDLEAELGLPAAVVALKQSIAASDGLLFATPEYNNGIPGPFKNAIDWASRPTADIARIFGGRPVAVVGASQGRFGTILSQNAWLPVLHKLGTVHWSGASLMISGAAREFTDGELSDEAQRERLRAFLAGFVDFIRGLKGSKGAML
jgi:NAD(P)H-dependent FMN reductase